MYMNITLKKDKIVQNVKMYLTRGQNPVIIYVKKYINTLELSQVRSVKGKGEPI